MPANDNSSPVTASDYDGQILKILPFYHQFRSEAIDLVMALHPDAGIWLDTGTGTGYLPEEALQAFPKTHFLLTDPSPTMLDKARIRLAGITPDRITFLPPLCSEELADALSVNPQVITAIQCHHYGNMEARRLATASCHKILEPGGVYITFENIRPDTEQGLEIGMERWIRFQKKTGRSDEEIKSHMNRFDREYFPITVNQHLELLRETGFATAEILWRSHMQAGFYAVK